jgi:hypothetical protein
LAQLVSATAARQSKLEMARVGDNSASISEQVYLDHGLCPAEIEKPAPGGAPQLFDEVDAAIMVHALVGLYDVARNRAKRVRVVVDARYSARRDLGRTYEPFALIDDQRYERHASAAQVDTALQRFAAQRFAADGDGYFAVWNGSLLAEPGAVEDNGDAIFDDQHVADAEASRELGVAAQVRERAVNGHERARPDELEHARLLASARMAARVHVGIRGARVQAHAASQ